MEAAFERVYHEQRQAIIRLSYLLVRDQQVAEELAQEAFLRLHLSFASIDNPAGFLRTVAVRLAATSASRHRMERDRIRLVSQNETAEMTDFDDTWAALGRLRPERATVLVLHFYEDLSQVEIARILDCPTATVRSRVRRGLDDLRKEIER